MNLFKLLAVGVVSCFATQDERMQEIIQRSALLDKKSAILDQLMDVEMKLGSSDIELTANTTATNNNSNSTSNSNSTADDHTTAFTKAGWAKLCALPGIMFCCWAIWKYNKNISDAKKAE